VIDAEGGAGAKFGGDTSSSSRNGKAWTTSAPTPAPRTWPAYAAKTRELLANREIHVCSPA